MKNRFKEKMIVIIIIVISAVAISSFYYGSKNSLAQEFRKISSLNVDYSGQLTVERLNQLTAFTENVILGNELVEIYKSDYPKVVKNYRISQKMYKDIYPVSGIKFAAVTIDDEVYFSYRTLGVDRDNFFKNQKVITCVKEVNSVNFYLDDYLYIYRNFVNSDNLEVKGTYVIAVDRDYVGEYIKNISSENFVEVYINGYKLFTNEKPENISDEYATYTYSGDYNLQFMYYFNRDDSKSVQRFLYISFTLSGVFFILYMILRYAAKNEIALMELKVKNLQSQINPHFLNNSLETINWTARIDGNEEIPKMIEALSTVINSNLDRGNKPTHNISEEMILVENYLYIIKMRYGDRLKIATQVDESALSVNVPSLSIQPLIENAIKYGIEPRGEGEVYIKISKKNLLDIEVINTGTISDDEISEIYRILKSNNTNHIGLANINTRFKYLFGKLYSFDVFMRDNKYTVVKITIKT